LRAADIAVDAQQQGAHAVAHAQILFGYHLVARQHRLDAAGLDHGIAALDALHRAGHQLLAAAEEILQDLLALGIADLLQDHLLGGLRADAAEFDRLQRLLDEFLELDVCVLLERLGQRDLLRRVFHRLVSHDLPATEGLEIPGFAVDSHAHVGIVAEAFLGGRGERHFQRDKDHVLVDVLLPRQSVHQQQNLTAHLQHLQLQNSILGTNRALSILASSRLTVPPSISNCSLPSATARITPVKLRRPATGTRSVSFACSPAKRT